VRAVYLIPSGEGGRLVCQLPPSDEAQTYVTVVDGGCPFCSADPFRVRGERPRDSSDDRATEADASCLKCGQDVGLLRVEMDTIFGVKEDRAVLQGRARVY
jgi:hypothetical protein